MKIRKTKKGFTIVELVIVIAVIGVLTAILVPTFISLTAKANKASDQSLVANLNTALKMQEAEDGAKNPTMHDAVLDLDAQGFDLGKLVTKSKESLLWNMETNQFELEKDQSGAKYWKIYDAAPASSTVSVYAKGNNFGTSVSVSGVGFDAGYVNNIATVNYSGGAAGNDVVIRTNGFDTTLNVNTDGNVKHYGSVGQLNIEKVAMESFHEHGTARSVNLTKGNFVIEQTGDVTLVSVLATEAGSVKLDIQGSLEVVAGNAAAYTVTAGAAQETVNAPIADNTLAIVNGTAKTSLAEADFGDGNKIVLLKDFAESQITLGSCTVIGNLTKLNAKVNGDKTILLKNVHTTNIKVDTSLGFNGSLTFDGGLLETSDPGTGDTNAAFFVGKGLGSYTFKNMTVAANITKGLKISSAKSVTVENCVFDASKLSCVVSGVEASMRSLSLIDIQEQNYSKNSNSTQKMTIRIVNNSFAYAPQGSIVPGVADSDTAAAIKIKTEKQNERSAGFETVTITGNSFANCYRDVSVGCNVYESNIAGKRADDRDATGNKVQSPIWTIADNTTTLTASIVAARGVLTFRATTDANSLAEKVGRIEGGCGLWETARSTH